jgi:serine/threonine protein kinase/Tfp pilus assembly protein PilF
MTISQGDRLGRYEIRSFIGAGGMGEVYLAKDLQLARNVALKLLPAAFVSDRQQMLRFIQEAKTASALNHPNIVTIYEIGQAGSRHFIATELIEGVTLRKRMMSAPVELLEALDIAIQVTGALTAAHEAGIVHRDIKPENIMLRTDGYIKVLDFGIAKLFRQQDDWRQALTLIATEPGIVMGTVQYMPPEQVRGQEVDARADVWSLGIVLYEMLAGRRPFDGPSKSDLLVQILDREPLALAEHVAATPAKLQQVITKTLCKNLEGRYQTVRELLFDLKNLKQEIEFKARIKSFSGPDHTGAALPVSPIERATMPPENEATILSRVTAHAAAPPKARRPRKAIDSLAVLPFINNSDAESMEYLSEGITETIINSLSQIQKLRVVPRSTVFRYKGSGIDPQQAGREMNVRAILTGRVLQRGEILLIKTELVDVMNDKQLWGEQYDRKFADILAVQDEIAGEISETLRLKLTASEKKRLTKRHTNDLKAYQFYLKGRYQWNKRTAEGFNKAIELFNQSIEEDPTYALAYVGLSDCYAVLGEYGVLPAKDSIPKAKAAVIKALEIDDQLAGAHAALGNIKMTYEWDWEGAKEQYERALAIDPNYASTHHFYAYYHLTIGNYQEAIKELRRAQELDPLSAIINMAVGDIFYYSRQYEQAIIELRKTLHMEPNFGPAHYCLGQALLQTGLFEEAVAEFHKSMNVSSAEAGLGYAYAMSGQTTDALRELERLKEQAKLRYVSPYQLAIICAGLGDRDQAFLWLDRAYEERDAWLTGIKVDPLLDALRPDPRFNELERRLKLAL